MSPEDISWWIHDMLEQDDQLDVVHGGQVLNSAYVFVLQKDDDGPEFRITVDFA